MKTGIGRQKLWICVYQNFGPSPLGRRVGSGVKAPTRQSDKAQNIQKCHVGPNFVWLFSCPRPCWARPVAALSAATVQDAVSIGTSALYYPIFSVLFFVLTRARCLHLHFRATNDGDSKIGAELGRDSPFSHAVQARLFECSTDAVRM